MSSIDALADQIATVEHGRRASRRQAQPKQTLTSAGGSNDLDAIADAMFAEQTRNGSDFKGTDEELNSAGNGGRSLFPYLSENSKETIPQSVRAAASFKGTQTGVLNYLRHQYGEDNVEPVYSQPRNILSPSGEHMPDPNYHREVVNYRIRLAQPSRDESGKPVPGKVVLFDPKGLDFGDVTDLAGDTVETVPAAIGGTIGAAVGAAGGGAAGSVAGPAGTVVGAAGGGTKGAVVGTAIGAGIGSAARQAIGAALPGAENMTAKDRLISAGANVAGSVAGEGIGRAASRVVGALVSPVERIAGRNAAREVVEPIFDRGVVDAAEASRAPFSMIPDEAPPVPFQPQDGVGAAAADINSGKLRGREAAIGNLQLANETGINFTPGQLTGGKEQIALERTVAQLPGGRNAMHAGDVARANQLSARVDETLKATAGESVGADAAARGVAGARKVQMEHLSDMRARAAMQGFGQARRDAGGAAIVPYNNTLATIDEIEGQYKGLLSSDSADAITKKLAEMRDSLVAAHDREETRVIPGNAYRSARTESVTVPGKASDVRGTIDQLQNDLRNFGKSAAGSGKFIKDLDPATDRSISARIFGALQQDLSAAAESQDPVLAKAASGLKQSRDVYREMSNAMNAEDDKIFDRVVGLIDKGDAPEKLVTALASGGDKGTFVPSQVKKTMATLIGTPEKPGIDPVAGRKLRGAVLEAMISGTRPGANTALGNADVAISPKRFASMVQDNAARIAALFHGDPDGLVAFQRAAKAARMLGDDAGINGGSQTAPMLAIKGLFEMASTIGPRAVTAPIETAKGVIKETSARASASSLAEVFNNPEARNIYLGLASPKRSVTREQIIAGMVRIKAVIERDRRLFGDVQQSDQGDAPQGPAAAVAINNKDSQ